MIRNLHRTGVSISDIARPTGRDRKTIRKVIQTPLTATPTPRTRKVRKIDPYTDYLNARIAAGVLNARKLYGEIVALGYRGKESMVRYYVQPYRHVRPAPATVRFETTPGEQAQVDWGHFGFIQHQGRRQRLYAFVMTLGWSRMLYLEFTVSADIAWWLRCHVHALTYFGGIPREMLHDNLKTAVVRRTPAGQIQWHPRYLDLADYYGFRLRACQPYRAQTKGKVERGIQYIRGNFWVGLQYTDLTDLNHQAWQWLTTVANVRIHGTTGTMPIERWPHEQLAPLPNRPPYDTNLITYRQSSRDCFVSYEGNFYSVPPAYVQQQLCLRVTEGDDLFIIHPDGHQIAHHRISTGKNQRIVQAAHHQGGVRQTAPPPMGGARQVPSPMWNAPPVEVRPLSVYAQCVEVSS